MDNFAHSDCVSRKGFIKEYFFKEREKNGLDFRFHFIIAIDCNLLFIGISERGSIKKYDISLPTGNNLCSNKCD